MPLPALGLPVNRSTEYSRIILERARDKFFTALPTTGTSTLNLKVLGDTISFRQTQIRSLYVVFKAKQL